MEGWLVAKVFVLPPHWLGRVDRGGDGGGGGGGGSGGGGDDGGGGGDGDERGIIFISIADQSDKLLQKFSLYLLYK